MRPRRVLALTALAVAIGSPAVVSAHVGFDPDRQPVHVHLLPRTAESGDSPEAILAEADLAGAGEPEPVARPDQVGDGGPIRAAGARAASRQRLQPDHLHPAAGALFRARRRASLRFTESFECGRTIQGACVLCRNAP